MGPKNSHFNNLIRDPIIRRKEKYVKLKVYLKWDFIKSE